MRVLHSRRQKVGQLASAMVFVLLLLNGYYTGAQQAPAQSAFLAPPQNPSSVGNFQFPSAGALSPKQELLPGVAFPQELSADAIKAFLGLRDDVYNNVLPETIDAMAASLLKIVAGAPLSPADRALMTARIAYLAGRSWNDHKNKKQAVPWFEQAVSAARSVIDISGETPTSLIVLAEPLGELSILKDLGFLLANGPKIGQHASKALESDPHNIKALLLKASALAYPPPIWGGNYKKALEAYAAILPITEPGLPRDVLFDLRVGIATAYANLKLSEHAAWWFRAALELYPENNYAKSELEKLSQ
ncbi:MAG: hypothetical protein ACYC1H_05260 [Rectinema subterraneum]